MELRHLRYFAAVAKELHFGKAAENLNLAQPALSMQIKQLEAELGVPLFLRTKRHVELTEAGKVFLNRTNHILGLMEEACAEASRIHQGESGELKLAFAGLVTFNLLPMILNVYRERFPNVKITLRHLTTSEQVHAILEEEMDIGILIPPIESLSLNLVAIQEEPFIVALHKTHSLVQSYSSIHISQIRHDSFIMPPRNAGPGYYDAIISLFYQAGFSPKITIEAQEIQTTVSLVASGMGVAILPSSIQHIQNENVVYLPILDSYTKIMTAVAWRKANSSPVVHSFINLIKDSVIPRLIST